MTHYLTNGKDQYLHIAIDSGGMDVFWVPLSDATPFQSFDDAASFIERVRERYKNENPQIVIR